MSVDAETVRPIPASFRDPAGRLIRHDCRILRVLTPEAAADLRTFLRTPIAERLQTAGQIVKTNPVAEMPPLAVEGEVFEHERVPFPSYPYEWPPEMLHAAATFTLDLCDQLLPDGYWLKDATPYNVLFRGPEPVFVDIPSFERRDPLNQTWLPYSQFVRTFLLVLLAARRLGRKTSDLLLTRREGPEPAEVYEWAGWRQRLSPGFLGSVSLPVWFERRRSQDEPGLYTSRPAGSAEQAEFVLRNLYGGLRRSLRRVAPVALESTWTGYLHHKSLYSPASLSEKEQFVREALAECRPEAVLDVGCNEGHFSRIAAQSGARVVAIDYDPAVAGRVWRFARAEKLDILPLVVDLTRPTPGIGWRNQECASFLERAHGHFDLVMMLAVIHHITVTERVPLAETLALAASMTRSHALIEFVGPEDPMFRKLVHGRDLLYSHLTVDEFEREAGCFFNTIRVHRLPGLDRWLFLLRRK